MAINFPDSPSLNDEYTAGGRTWKWNGTSWNALPLTILDTKVDETNGAVTTASTSLTVVRNITLSTSAPTGGADGDVWLVYTP